eukprot:TRINITY_DN5161_c0_g1_i2.p1 TRINITY_DN5161_c0_g1~~TRINITY_DN5161_c0_g1_i2.p1  ORF type:complete len:168 (-),score=54.33 TRINITY_DN5161_c0_g1_i2:141-644(-)
MNPKEWKPVRNADSSKLEEGFRVYYGPKDEEMNFTENVIYFIQSVDWTEPWIVSLVIFHIFLVTFVYFTRKMVNVQTILFMLLFGFLYLTERFNGWAMENWETFATRPYFDKNGSFITFMFSFPLVLVEIFILINFLRIMSDLLVKVKRAQFKREANAKKEVSKKKD